MELIDKRFGNYEIESTLGHGGMATVYRARQVSLNRAVAFKVLGTSFAMDQTVRKRFEQEALAVAQLSHPNIVPVYDYGDDAELGILYIVMEMVTGGSFSGLRHRRLSPAEIVPAVAQIGRALDYAHRQGIVHRDVKPGNILLNNDGRPMLTDFGLVRWESTSLHTETGITVGTPTYMSPEQAQGGELDGRADEYSLAMVLYELLAGRPAFEGSTAVDVMHQIVYDPLPPPRQFNAAIPRELESVLLHALARDRKDRYATAAEFSEALDKTLKRARPAPVNLSTLAAASHAEEHTIGTGTPSTAIDEQTTPSTPTVRGRMRRAGGRVLGGAGRALRIALLAVLAFGSAGALIAANLGAGTAERTLGEYGWPWGDTRGEQPKVWDESELLAQMDPWLAANGLGGLSNRQVRILPNNAIFVYGETPYAALSVELQLYVISGALQVRWEHLNGVTPFVIGDIVAAGANRGLQRAYAGAPAAVERVETTSGQLLMYFKSK
ncbi:MAG: serine/threonine protein kinase [Chloroflexi bacterium]|nr:serine/threonine protein kinase [Chloroflexota bacterium]